ncbi:MAG: hypothetical protein LAO55_07230 [Acidobacteriia bacterium]|nr:hypothetical protein [Terriglobia bacterium]
MRLRVVVMLVPALAALALLAQTQEAFYGLWKVDMSKSKYSPGPAPKSNMKKYEPWKDGFKATQDMVTAKGEKVHVEVIAKVDGKDYPGKGSPDADTYAFKRIDARSYEVTQKKDGKVTIVAKMVVAPDGKSRSIVQTGKTAKGEPVNNTIYWDKVEVSQK